MTFNFEIWDDGFRQMSPEIIQLFHFYFYFLLYKQVEQSQFQQLELQLVSPRDKGFNDRHQMDGSYWQK